MTDKPAVYRDDVLAARQSENDRIATREAADRREKERAEEQAFWDRAFCAALTGYLADGGLQRHLEAMSWKVSRAELSWADEDDPIMRRLGCMADAALSRRRSRNQGDDNG